MTQKEKPQSNIIALISYLVPPFTGILFFFIEKEDKFVRFHAFQSILFGITVFGLSVVLDLVWIPLLSTLLFAGFNLGTFVIWLYLMWNAYNNKRYELPYLGKIAREQTQK